MKYEIRYYEVKSSRYHDGNDLKEYHEVVIEADGYYIEDGFITFYESVGDPQYPYVAKNNIYSINAKNVITIITVLQQKEE